jgi:hypothetical protein
VLAFLQQLATIFEHVNNADPQRGGPHARDTRTQIIFWDRRQFQELCLALGRHLAAILYDRQDRLLRALAWIFPPEELQELDETIDDQRPALAFVKDTIRRLVRVPAIHALTLFNVAEHYHHGDNPLNPPDHFYREPLSDTIPRERIYELWSLSAGGAAGVIRWGPVVKTYNQLMESFSRTVDQQASALASIAWRLRTDFGPRLKAEAPKLRLAVPNWAAGVAHDSKLWIAWARFEAAVGRASNHLMFMADPDEVEASNEGLRLLREVQTFPDGAVEYDVSADSLNTKLRAPNDYLCLSVDAIPGFLGLPTWAVIPRDLLPADMRWMVNVPIHKLFSVRLEQLDRAHHTATIRLNGFWGRTAVDMHRLRAQIQQHLAAEFAGSLTLVPGLGPDIVVARLERILSDVGDPPIAAPAPAALGALGMANRPIRAGRSPVTPLARVLWEGGALHAAIARGPADTARVVAHVRERAGLNASQADAVSVGASRRLAVIWGPPGTGKTKTCAALVHGVIADEARVQRAGPYAILVTGPTYKAVGELVERLTVALVDDPAARCRVYTVYSPSRPDRFPIPANLPAQLGIVETISQRDDAAFLQMRADLDGGTDVVVVATVTHQCARIAEQLARIDDVRQSLWPLFDFVLIDETSQVDMTTGVMPLALLKPDFQLVVAGDHLQMPPVVEAEPPLGAEHLVGSLQRYLSERFNVEPAPLLRNYRSNGDIVAYTRRLGYPPNLEAANPGTAIALVREPADLRLALQAVGLPWSPAWVEIIDPTRPIVGVTYPDGTAGQANPFEAACVASVVWLLRQCSARTLAGRPDSPVEPEAWDDESFWKIGVGIVTPHRAQRAQVVRALVDAFPETDPNLIDSAVDTVERFQGGERHTILISFGVGDPDVIRGEERFLLQLERSNVAISRAMGKCIVFLSDEVANHIPDDRRAAATAHALRGIVDEWCVQRHAETVPFGGIDRSMTVRWR